MLLLDHARWGQTPEDVRRLAMSAPHRHTRERFLALHEITRQSGGATRVALRGPAPADHDGLAARLQRTRTPALWSTATLAAVSPLRPHRGRPLCDHPRRPTYRRRSPNQRFTLKQNPLKEEHLDEFVARYRSGAQHERVESERFRRFPYAELVKRDRLNLDLTWLRDDSLEGASSLPPPDVIAAEIVENLEAALAQFRQVAKALERRTGEADGGSVPSVMLAAK
jgi:hypothetical protein